MQNICDGKYKKITKWKNLNNLKKKSEYTFQNLFPNKIVSLRKNVFLCHQHQTQNTFDIKSGKGLAYSHKKYLYTLYKMWSLIVSMPAQNIRYVFVYWIS